MRLNSGLITRVSYDFCFWYYVEVLGGYHEVNDTFADVVDLNPDVPEEGIDGP